MFWITPKRHPKRTRTGAGAPGAAGARAHRRSRCVDLYSNLGRVVDLSLTGAGLLTESERFRPGMRETFRLQTGAGPLVFEATVIWVRPADHRLFRVGLRFQPPDEAQRAAMKSLCQRLYEAELDRRESALRKR
jgi:hypothetical protein